MAKPLGDPEPGGPELIGSILARQLFDLGLTTRLKQIEAVTCWSEVVGKKIAEASRALNYRDERLWVSVPSATWRQELIGLKPRLIQKLNNRLKENVVKDIFFVA